MNNKEIINDITVTQTIKEIAETYEEVSVMKIQKIRNSVLTTRDFMLRLSEIFAEVRYSYKEEIKALRKIKKLKNKQNTYSTLKKTKELAQVLVTTNEHLVGDIPYKVFSSFIEDITKQKGDLIIIGSVGKGLIETIFGQNKKFYYFDLPPIGSGIKVIEKLIRVLIQYKNITVYHGKFLNLVNQIQVKSNILEDIEKTAKLNNTNNKEKKYLFEPSLEKILNFFEIQIFASLFRQSLDEASLANLGSRIKSMEQATESATERIKTLKMLRIRFNKHLENKKQIQRLAGMTLWN